MAHPHWCSGRSAPSGCCQLLAAAYSGQRIVLLEKFTVEAWVDAVSRHRVKWSGVQPTVIRMLLEADVPPSDLASLAYLPGGSGPLEPELQREFEARYGIPLLWGYGATSSPAPCAPGRPSCAPSTATPNRTVGRPLPGVRCASSNPTPAPPYPAGRGVLSARVDVLGPQWITTTDIASIDDDGFVTVHGRGDGAINRGGFKVLPERIRKALLTHPAVRDACVVSVPDPARRSAVRRRRIRPGAPSPTVDELKAAVREQLPAPLRSGGDRLRRRTAPQRGDESAGGRSARVVRPATKVRPGPGRGATTGARRRPDRRPPGRTTRGPARHRSDRKGSGARCPCPAPPCGPPRQPERSGRSRRSVPATGSVTPWRTWRVLIRDSSNPMLASISLRQVGPASPR